MKKMYETKNIILTPFCRQLIKDIESTYEDWFYDPVVTKYNSHGLFPYGKEKMEKYLDMAESGKEDIVWAIISKCQNKHIGNVSLQRINWINRSAEFAIVIGCPNYYGRGVAYEAIEILLFHAFEKLNLHRVWTGTASSNLGMRRVCEKLGMGFEGELNDAMFLNGKYENIAMYYILDRMWKRMNGERNNN